MVAVVQLVEHLVVVQDVAGSSPVIRSQSGIHTIPLGVVGWPRGEAAACKAVYAGSNPVLTSQQNNCFVSAIGAAVARFPDTEEVTGSIPVSPTIKPDLLIRLFCILLAVWVKGQNVCPESRIFTD